MRGWGGDEDAEILLAGPARTAPWRALGVEGAHREVVRGLLREEGDADGLVGGVWRGRRGGCCGLHGSLGPATTAAVVPLPPILLDAPVSTDPGVLVNAPVGSLLGDPLLLPPVVAVREGSTALSCVGNSSSGGCASAGLADRYNNSAGISGGCSKALRRSLPSLQFPALLRARHYLVVQEAQESAISYPASTTPPPEGDDTRPEIAERDKGFPVRKVELTVVLVRTPFKTPTPHSSPATKLHSQEPAST
ncbi:hypothetical protein V500_02634 [Pseudogymnoascus sp. VKM F-4518 (FW-2643)]|nr:hypothetical protein V500_02634 [Pseudogymnoascus sp. VKM F-4518 (FW-2643)]